MFSGLIEKLQKTFGEFVTIRHSLQGDVSVSSEAEFAAFCRLVCEKEEEEEGVVTPKTPAAAEREADGRKEREPEAEHRARRPRHHLLRPSTLARRG